MPSDDISLGLWIVLWLMILARFVLGKIGSMEERLKQNLGESFRKSERRLKQHIEEGMNEILRRNNETAPPPECPEVLPLSPVVIKEPAQPVSTVPEHVHEEAPTDTVPVDVEPVDVMSREDAKLPPKRAAMQKTPWETRKPPVTEERDEPGFFSLIVQRFFSWLLTEGNIWVCTGVLLFFAGFGLLFNYVIQFGLMTLEMRFAAAALTGIVMTAVGFKLRERRRAYALILQGGGMGVLYLTVLGAAKLIPDTAGIPILSPPFAISAMLTLSVFTVLLALLQDYQPLAVFAILGGFSAPVIIRADSFDQVTLFLIYTLLNLEILVISFMRDWRVLNRMGLILTVVVTAVLGFRNWRQELFYFTEPFLLIFLADYTIISLNIGGGKRRHIEPGAARAPDIILALSVPFSFFFLQMKAVSHFRYGMALTCLGMGLWYLAFGFFMRRWSERTADENIQKNRRSLSHLYMLLCLLFSNLAVPYFFEDKTSSAIWAVEAAFLIAMACRSGDYKALIGGIVLHTGALWLYSHELARLNFDMASKLSPLLISGVMFSASFWVSGFWTSRFYPSIDDSMREKWQTALRKLWGSDTNLDGTRVRGTLSWTFTVIGSLWWWYTMYDQIPRIGLFWLTPFSIVCLTALAGCWMSVRFGWKAAKFLFAFTVALFFVLDIISIIESFHRAGIMRSFSLVFSTRATIGGNAWINAVSYLAGIGGSIYLLRRTAATFLSRAFLFASVFVGLTLSARAAHSLGFLLNDALAWGNFFFALPLPALLFFLRGAFMKNEIFDDYRHPLAYSTGAFLILQARDFYLSFFREGTAVLGVFIPVLNPLELYQAAFLVSLVLWVQIFIADNRPFKKWNMPVQLGIGALFFLWLNQVAARGTWWYWGEMLYSPLRVFLTPQCQAVVAIVWGVLGLCAVLYGQRTRSRNIWRAGAWLLAADMLKLLLFDLRGAATLTRILAFLVLGALFILIGWAAPLPPKEEE